MGDPQRERLEGTREGHDPAAGRSPDTSGAGPPRPVSESDRAHWDQRYADAGPSPLDAPGLPEAFAPFEPLFPHQGHALELACGRGRAALWLATRGMTVLAVDVSPVAIELARRQAERLGLADRCRFDVVDLDGGLPPGPPADLILCHLFRDARLTPAITGRLARNGLVAVATLSEVGAAPGRFRARQGELRETFAELDVLSHTEADGLATIVARRQSEPASAPAPSARTR